MDACKVSAADCAQNRSAKHRALAILEQDNGHARDASVPLGRDALREHALHLFRPAIVPEHSWCERMLSLIK
jgi:hypothetical protein